MGEVSAQKLKRAFDLYGDLMDFLPEESLSKKLPDLPSNEFGQQLWCVIGARNSYFKALKAGSWQGFECPLNWEETTSKEAVSKALKETAGQVVEFFESKSAYSESILLDLLEHEVQHHGQIIRYLYGLKLGVPDSWKKRYSLD